MSQVATEKKEAMWVHCESCSHEWVGAWLPLPVDVVARLMKALCPRCGGKKTRLGQIPKDTTEGDPIAWLTNGDTGTSSLTIWHLMMGREMPPNRWPSVPLDPSDFGRCYRLLKVMPTWRARLPEVAQRHPKWQPMVQAWDELTALYELELPTGMCPKLYDRMKELRGIRPARERRGPTEQEPE